MAAAGGGGGGGGAHLDEQINQIFDTLAVMQAQLNVLVPAGGAEQVPVAALPPGFAALPAAVAQLAGLPAAIAELQAAVAALAPPARAAVAAAAVQAAGAPQLTIRQRISAARSANHHERDDVFVPVVRGDGTNPPHWPPNFTRRKLMEMAPAAAQQLLGDYQLSINGGQWTLRNRIAKHIGAITF